MAIPDILHSTNHHRFLLVEPFVQIACCVHTHSRLSSWPDSHVHNLDTVCGQMWRYQTSFHMWDTSCTCEQLEYHSRDRISFFEGSYWYHCMLGTHLGWYNRRSSNIIAIDALRSISTIGKLGLKLLTLYIGCNKTFALTAFKELSHACIMTKYVSCVSTLSEKTAWSVGEVTSGLALTYWWCFLHRSVELWPVSPHRHHHQRDHVGHVSLLLHPHLGQTGLKLSQGTDWGQSIGPTCPLFFRVQAPCVAF